MASVSGRGNRYDVPCEKNTNTILVVLISAFWPNASAESDVEATAQSALLRWESMAREKGLLQDFQYFNYAASSQNPVQSYGLDNLEFLKHVSKKYDHAQILQNRVGGFKLHV